MKVLYEDSDITVCFKEAGVNSEESAKANMPALIEAHTGKKPFTVHRLDRETGGIMVYALNKKSASALSQQIKDGKFVKIYLAVVRGGAEEQSGTMTDYLVHDKRKNKVSVSSSGNRDAKKAVLDYEITACEQGFSLARILLHTGRTHQIRVQFSSRNMPVYGDSKYGGGAGELALCAYFLSFEHPMTGRRMEFTLPPDISVTPWCLFSEKIKNITE